jgi:hypothetical protein
MFRRRLPIDLKALVFAGFVSAGAFKGDSRLAWLPVDLTLALMGLSVLIAVREVIRKRACLNVTIFAILITFTLFLVPVVWTDWSDYAVMKVAKLFTITLSATLLPAALFRTDEDLRSLYNAIIIYSCLMYVDAFSLWHLGDVGDVVNKPTALSAETGRVIESGRLTTSSSNTLGLGQMAGLAIIAVTLTSIEGRLPRFVGSLILVGPQIVVMIGAGSRGPLVALVVAMGITATLLYRRGVARARLALVGSSLFLFAVLSLSLAPEASRTRLEELMAGEGVEGSLRSDLYDVALRHIVDNPFGVGWGGFVRVYGCVDNAMGICNYPHNIILEVFLECGWIIGAFFTALVAAAIGRAALVVSRHPTISYYIVSCSYVYYLINSLFSGDINDNRMLFLFMTLCLTVGADRPHSAKVQRTARGILTS